MDWEFSVSVLRSMFAALPTTLSLAAVSFVLSLLLAVVIAGIDYFKVPVLRQVCAVYVSFFRGTPLIPQLFLLYFGIPTFIPELRDIPAFAVCIVGLTLNSALYERGGERSASVCACGTEGGGSGPWDDSPAGNGPLFSRGVRVAIPSCLTTWWTL